MNTDKRLRREFAVALAVVAVAALIAWAAVSRIKRFVTDPISHIGPAPDVTISDVDRLFQENFELANRGMEILWQHQELFEDLMTLEERSSGCSIGNVWRFERINYRLYMSDEEWQTVLDMVETLNPYLILYEPPRSRAHSVALFYSAVADDELAWEDAYAQVLYAYARCTEADHEGYDPACAEQAFTVKWSTFALVGSTYEPLPREGWYRAAKVIRRKKGP